MFIFGILSNLLFLAILGAIGYAIVKGISGRRAQGGAESAPGSLRRLFMFGSLYFAVHIAAWGTAGFVDAASTSGTIAEPLAVIIVAVPVAAVLARWAWRTVADPLERGPAFGLYLNLMSFTALLVLMVTGFAVGTWLIADNSLPEFELAAFFVWAGVWVAHWLVWKRFDADVFNLHLFLGSAAGLMLTAI